MPARDTCAACGAAGPLDVRGRGSARRALAALREGPRLDVSATERGAARRAPAARQTSDASGLRTPRAARNAALLVPGALLALAFDHPAALVALAALVAVPAVTLAGYFVAYGASAVAGDLGEFLRGPSEAGSRPARPTLRIPDERPPAADVPGRARFVGTVRVRSAGRSPLRHAPAAAFRVVGHGPLGAIDDAGGADFDLETDEGVLRVVWGPAFVTLDVRDPPRTVRPDAGLTRFLVERAVFPALGPVRLAEAALVDGEAVVVEGVLGLRDRPAGYREPARARVLTGTTASPLVLARRADDGPSTG